MQAIVRSLVLTGSRSSCASVLADANLKCSSDGEESEVPECNLGGEDPGISEKCRFHIINVSNVFGIVAYVGAGSAIHSENECRIPLLNCR